MSRAAESSRQIRAEAASWVARLHGPDRDAELEAGLKRWLTKDPAHARAFEFATEVWQETGDLPFELPESRRGSLRDRPRARRRHPALAWVAASAIVTLGALFIYVHMARGKAFETGIGEQRTFTLSDGTRVELNTRSRLVVRYDERARRVELKDGEAYFDVARQKERPFIVVAAGREIIALGTVFLVRNDGDQVTVVLLEGRVAVAPADAEHRTDGAAPTDTGDSRNRSLHVLRAGQRLRLATHAPPLVDSPPLDKITAWQRGQLIFEDTPLSEAVAEFNRYSEARIELGSAELARIRVGGAFRVGDVSSFARAVADANGLDVIDRGGQVLLARSRPSVP